MAKYSKTQISYIMDRLKKQFKSEWEVKEELRKKYTPPKPKAVSDWEKKCEEARVKATKEAAEKTKGKTAYLQKIQDMITLSDTDFDIEKAIKEINSL